MKKYSGLIGSIALMTLLLSGCSEEMLFAKSNPGQAQTAAGEPAEKNNNTSNSDQAGQHASDAGTSVDNSKPADKKAEVPPVQNSDESIQVISNPESIPVLVNKQNKLPDDYNPQDLVSADIPFVSHATNEKRKMRQEAASAINQLFAGAKTQGISLLGVSAYRSHATQTTLFNYYVNRDGYEQARTYSAVPGTSEHETGLSIDVTGADGRCAAESCFGGTPEANWLQAHAAEYGFIIRYPQGKENITGYQYEPWHLRYVGKEIALEIMNSGTTLEEYFNEVPVNN